MTGYESKRSAARDKLVDDRRAYYEKFDDLYAVYLNGFYDGKKAAQPEEEKLHPVSIGVDVTQAGTSVTAFYRKPDAVMEMFYAQFHPMPQPEQEPVAWLCSPDENGLFGLPTADKACKDCFPVYTAPPQPKQEPVANDRALQLVTYQMNHWRAYALELQERLVKYEGGAPMLLNKEKNT